MFVIYLNTEKLTKKEILQRRKILEQQLTIINHYPEEFLERLGAKGLEHFINEIVDELNYLSKLLKNYR